MPLPPPDLVDLVSQLKLMIEALPASSGASDDVRSYDPALGRRRSPAASRRGEVYRVDPERGRRRQRRIRHPATGETIALHAYWDRIFGGYSSPYGAVFDAVNNGIADIAEQDRRGGFQTRKPGSTRAPSSRSNSPTHHP
jgi:hypothetical protein